MENNKVPELSRQLKNFKIIARFSNIFTSVVMSVTAIVMVYLCASPVAFTVHESVNDVFYSVKDVSRIDNLCIMNEILFTLYVICIFVVILSHFFRKKVSIKTLQEKEEVIKIRRVVKYNLFKAALFDVFMLLVVIMNHMIN